MLYESIALPTELNWRQTSLHAMFGSEVWQANLRRSRAQIAGKQARLEDGEGRIATGNQKQAIRSPVVHGWLRKGRIKGWKPPHPLPRQAYGGQADPVLHNFVEERKSRPEVSFYEPAVPVVGAHPSFWQGRGAAPARRPQPGVPSW